MGSDSTEMPSAMVALAAVPRLEESNSSTAVALLEAGTVIVAVMITLAAVMLMETKEASTPAMVAILPSRSEMSEMLKSPMLPLACSVSTTVSVEGGGGDGGSDGGGGLGGGGEGGGDGGGGLGGGGEG
eukprot:scaffold72664_cov57-Phaeocystis_antarctica.AAC.1